MTRPATKFGVPWEGFIANAIFTAIVTILVVRRPHGFAIGILIHFVLRELCRVDPHFFWRWRLFFQTKALSTRLTSAFWGGSRLQSIEGEAAVRGRLEDIPMKLRGERLLSEYVPWVDHIGDDMMLMRDGSVMMMLAVDGLPHETADDEVINYLHNRLEFAVRDVAQPGLIFHHLQCRGTADPSMYPKGKFRSRFAELLDEHYRGKLFGSGFMWLNRSYLAVILPANMIGGRRLQRLSWLLPSAAAGEAPGGSYRASAPDRRRHDGASESLQSACPGYR